MPTYSFYNNQTNEQFDAVMKISEREVYLKDNPHITTVVSAPALVSGISITNRVPDGFKEVLSKAAEAHPTSALAKKHGRRSAKEVKTQQIVNKHLGI
jgi:hypothetical protein